MQADEARELRLEIFEQYTKALEMHIKEWPHLGDCEWNCTTVGPLRELIAKVRLAALKEAVGIALLTPFRAHASDDIDFHSGCEQTRERIVAAIRSLAERASKGAAK